MEKMFFRIWHWFTVLGIIVSTVLTTYSGKKEYNLSEIDYQLSRRIETCSIPDIVSIFLASGYGNLGIIVPSLREGTKSVSIPLPSIRGWDIGSQPVIKIPFRQVIWGLNSGTTPAEIRGFIILSKEGKMQYIVEDYWPTFQYSNQTPPLPYAIIEWEGREVRVFAKDLMVGKDNLYYQNCLSALNIQEEILHRPVKEWKVIQEGVVPRDGYTHLLDLINIYWRYVLEPLQIHRYSYPFSIPENIEVDITYDEKKRVREVTERIGKDRIRTYCLRYDINGGIANLNLKHYLFPEVKEEKGNVNLAEKVSAEPIIEVLIEYQTLSKFVHPKKVEFLLKKEKITQWVLGKLEECQTYRPLSQQVIQLFNWNPYPPKFQIWSAHPTIDEDLKILEEILQVLPYNRKKVNRSYYFFAMLMTYGKLKKEKEALQLLREELDWLEKNTESSIFSREIFEILRVAYQYFPWRLADKILAEYWNQLSPLSIKEFLSWSNCYYYEPQTLSSYIHVHCKDAGLYFLFCLKQFEHSSNPEHKKFYAERIQKVALYLSQRKNFLYHQNTTGDGIWSIWKELVTQQAVLKGYFKTKDHLIKRLNPVKEILAQPQLMEFYELEDFIGELLKERGTPSTPARNYLFKINMDLK